MIHEDVVSNWVYEHYLIYLSLSIADSDCVISDNEMEKIKCSALQSLNQERCATLIDDVYQEFWSHSQDERINYIKNNAYKFLRTNFIKNKVIEHLQNLVSNKTEDSEEYIMFRFIRKVINNCDIIS